MSVCSVRSCASSTIITLHDLANLISTVILPEAHTGPCFGAQEAQTRRFIATAMDSSRKPSPAPHLDEAEEDVGVQRALVRLVDHHHAVRREVGLAQELAQQHAVRHVPAAAVGRRLGRLVARATGGWAAVGTVGRLGGWSAGRAT